MLVDLGRNDLGRVCEYGTVNVPEMMVIERYSHVMHIVSDVQGRLAQGHDAISLLKATFPAVRSAGRRKFGLWRSSRSWRGAARLVCRRGGYIDYDGTMDTCIAIRTIVMQGKTCYLQARRGHRRRQRPHLRVGGDVEQGESPVRSGFGGRKRV